MDEIFKRAYSIFSELIGDGMCILPPDKDFLFYEKYDFSYIDKTHRDKETGLVGKYEKPPDGEKYNVYDYPCARGNKYLIGFADSANKMGHLAFCNSLIDQNNLHLYENGHGTMVRHPTQVPWNNPKNCTRDQLIAYAAGCWRAGKNEIVQRLLDEHEKRTNIFGMPLCQNTDDNCPGTTKYHTELGQEIFVETDVLSPHEVMFLKICAGDKQAYKDPIGQMCLQLAIEATDKDVELEKNQLIVMAIVCGRLDLYVFVHDNYKENILYYWDNHTLGHDHRDQRQIGEAYLKVIEYELKRYSGQRHPIITGIPIETIKILLKNTEYLGKILKGDVPAVIEYIELFTKALITDTQKVAQEIEIYISEAFKKPLSILNIPFMPINPIIEIMNIFSNKTDLSEVYFRLNEIQKSITELKELSKSISEDIKAIPEKNAAFQSMLELNSTIEDFEINKTEYCKLIENNDIEDIKDSEVVQRFKEISEEFIKEISKFKQLHNDYTYVPNFISYMDMHLTSLVLSNATARRINSILEIQYLPWLENIKNNKTEGSFLNFFNSMKSEQESNKNTLPSLYTLVFRLSRYNLNLNVGIDILGNYIKTDYISNTLLSETRIKEISILLEKNIISEIHLPELISERKIEPVNFSFEDPLYGLSRLDFTISLENFEGTGSIQYIQIFRDLCASVPNNNSFPWPIHNFNEYERIKNENIILGESIIKHGMIQLSVISAIERINEIIDLNKNKF